jgi:N utilization substance protein B
MASRHISRSVVLQTLFESDMQNALSESAASSVLERNLKDPAHGDTDREFAVFLLSGILRKRDELDGIIAKAAPQWPLDKIAPVDRNILRIGLFELLFGDRSAVPPKVALNEAIELGKSYGGDATGKFVNGVLGAVYRDIGSPGKTDAVKTPVPLPHEALGGAIVCAHEEGMTWIAMVLDAFGKWTLPKARSRENELSDSAAKRAMKDELGVDADIAEPVGEHEYIAHEPETGRIARTVGYYLAVLPKKQKLTVKKSEGVKDARWVSEEELKDIPSYNDLMSVIEAGIAAAKRI